MMSRNSSSKVLGSMSTSISLVVGAMMADPWRSGVGLTPPVHSRISGLALKTFSCPGSTVVRQDDMKTNRKNRSAKRLTVRNLGLNGRLGLGGKEGAVPTLRRMAESPERSL